MKIGYGKNGQPINYCTICGAFVDENGKKWISELYWHQIALKGSECL